MSQQSKILVVEDEALTGMELQKKLVLWGYEVVGIVSSGEDAVKKALELEPDLILMDILLKGCMNGIDAAKVIMENKEIPIIYLTAYCNSETFQGAKITQPQAYLIKPFDENELKFAIEMAFYGHQSRLSLKKSEAHYRVLAESAPDMIFIINKDLMVDYVNESSLKHLKLRKEEIIGKPVQNIFSKQVFDMQIKALQNVFCTGNSMRVKNPFIFPSCELWLDTRLKALRNDKGEIYAVMGISRECTENNFQEHQQDKLKIGPDSG
ncbi:response regulator [Methanobacterium sp.]|uniref:response regulator n=1 Tax=Methanobacterium sp. TaxID=2164 RepID=UPI0025D3B484|nr:response regulator [Methanobacterium sp.]MBI5459698.1 response regulator [Methanobacterium sp.]